MKDSGKLKFNAPILASKRPPDRYKPRVGSPGSESGVGDSKTYWPITRSPTLMLGKTGCSTDATTAVKSKLIGLASDVGAVAVKPIARNRRGTSVFMQGPPISRSGRCHRFR